MTPVSAAVVSSAVDLPDTWAYGVGTLHGGWLLELLASHALATTRYPHPLAVSAHYLSPPKVGPAQLDVEVLREGRSVGTSRARLSQGGHARVEALLTAGRLPAEDVAATLSEGAPPSLPPRSQCWRNSLLPGQQRNGITEQLDVLIDPSTAIWMPASAPPAAAPTDGGSTGGGPTEGEPTEGEPTEGEPIDDGLAGVAQRDSRSTAGEGLTAGAGSSTEIRAWVRAADGRDADPLSLLTVADALPPVTFQLGIAGWVPTVELTVLVRALPAPGWLRCVQRARLMHGGWLDEECEVWDSRDRLVAQARQLAAYRT